MQSDSPLPTLIATTSIITTTTSLPPPPQPQQSTVDPILVSRIGELEQHMEDLIQNNLALEERLDKQGTRLYNLDNLNIPHKEILQQRMFEDNSYKAHEAQNDLYEALQNSLELDYSNQRLADQEEARKKKRKMRAALRTPSGSPPSPPPPPTPPAGASGAPDTSGASRSSQLLPPPPPLSTGASRSDQLQGSKAPSSSKPAASIHQSMAWTTSDTRFKSTGFTAALELSPTDYLMQDDSIPEEHVHLFDDEDFENDHQPKADSRKDWWKPLPEEERPTTPEPAWTIPSSNKYDNLHELVLPKDVIHLQFQTEECYKTLTAQVDWINLEGDHVKIDVNRPLPLGGPPVQNMASLTGGLIDRSSILTDMILRRVEKIADFQEYTIAEKDFKNMYPSDFKDLNLLLLQGHLDHLPGSNKRMLSTAVKQWTRNLVIQKWVKDFQLGIESYQTHSVPDAVDDAISIANRMIFFDLSIARCYTSFSDGVESILEATRLLESRIQGQSGLNPGMIRASGTEKDVDKEQRVIVLLNGTEDEKESSWNSGMLCWLSCSVY
ncbi:hypothetical protein Tco_0670855 [Tanacetum coccineum]